MTFQKRIEHIWEYYRWQILLAVLAVAVLVGIRAEWKGRDVPDYEIAMVTRQEITAEELRLLTDCFRSAAETLEKGKNNVQITAFVYAPRPEEENSGAYLDLYNGVAMNAELTSGNCLIYIVDEPAYEMLRGQGENFLAETDKVLLERLFPGRLPETLGQLRVCMRSPESVFLETAKSVQSRFDVHAQLIQSCLS